MGNVKEGLRSRTGKWVALLGICVAGIGLVGSGTGRGEEPVARALGAVFTPQAILVDTHGTVRYLGRIDDNPDPEKVVRRDLKEAMDALLDGKPIVRTRTLVTGCAIFREKAALPANAAKSAFTYTR